MQKEQRRYTANLWRVLTNESKDKVIVVKIYQISAIAIYQIECFENGEFSQAMAVNGETNAWRVACNMLEEY